MTALNDSMIHLLDQTPERIQAWLAAQGVPGYRARQVWQWIFARGITKFDEMTDLPGALRQRFAADFQIWTTRVAAHRKADDGAEKLLLELADGERIECVLLRDDRGHCTICISTQIGCAMGCAFCASGMDGLVRNLTTGEIIEQMLRLRQCLADGERISHVVVMGMGEPLANLEGLLPALAVASSRDGLGIGARRITISTVGLPAGIRRLAGLNLQYHLAVSLHAADDVLRDRLVPANRKVGIAAVLAVADEYFEQTGRRVTFEYVVLKDVNDGDSHARDLAARLRGRPALVNLIAFNPVAGLPFRSPLSSNVLRFAETLREAGIAVKLRYRKGDEIDAACGQLRRRNARADDG